MLETRQDTTKERKMKNGNTEVKPMIQEDTLIVAIDIGMTKNTVYCGNLYGKGTGVAEFDHSREGYEKLLYRITTAQKRCNCARAVVGYEPTGPYGEPLVHYLMGKRIPLVQINPLHTKKVKELNDNSPLKTDKKDPRVIADIMRLGRTLSVVVPKGDAAELRRLMNVRDRHSEERVALINYVRQLVFILLPEFTTLFKRLRSATGLMLLRDYIATGLLWETECATLTRAIHTASRGQLGQALAIDLTAMISGSVGIREGMTGIMMDIEHAAAQIALLDSFIKRTEQTMNILLEKIPYARKMRSIKGIGTVTIAGLIGEVGDFTAFATQRQVMKFAGLNLYEVSSGEHRGKRRISKRGRSRMRNLLYLAALNTVRTKGIMHDYYQRLLQNGLHKIAALVAVARKLLMIIHAMMRDDCCYGIQPQEVVLAA
jgi:transposase